MFTKKRLIVKTIIWRILAFAITLIIALIETGSFQDSSLISIIDFISKSFILYFYELYWLRVKYGIIEENGEKIRTKKRVFVKTAIWRILAMILTALTVFAITRDFKEAISISIYTMIAKTIFLFIYEFVWHRIKWGEINQKEDVEIEEF